MRENVALCFGVGAGVMDKYLFSGLKVLDVATVIAGPAAAVMLADFGADVIKIEKPGSGDILRQVGRTTTMPGADSDYMWNLEGRNKRGIVLDLKTDEGMEVLRKLVAGCDVYITNMPFASRESLGLTYEDLRPLNPGMIYASLTAYGEKGPEREGTGFDMVAYWARSGLMDLMRRHGTQPTEGLPGMGDHPTAIALYAGIVTALLHRERTGEGGMVHTSLLANGLWSVSAIPQGIMAGADIGEYRERRRAPRALGRVYRCADGRWLQFNMIRTEELLFLMFDAMDASRLLFDERFSTEHGRSENREALIALIAEIIEQRDSHEWMARFDAVQVPVNRVGIVEEHANDPQLLDNGMIVPVADDGFEVPSVVSHPINVANLPRVGPKHPPKLGEHSEEILRELGYDTAAISAMRERGVI